MPAAISVKLSISSEVRLVDLVHEAVERVATLAGLEEEEAMNLGLATREATINAIVHGNRRDPTLPVDVTVQTSSRSVRIRVLDQGAGFDPNAMPDPTKGENLLKTSGRGLLLIRAFVDEVKVRPRRDRGTEVTLVKRLRPVRRADDSRNEGRTGA